MKRIEKIVIWYYGIIQIIHLLGNCGTIIGDKTTMIHAVATGLSPLGINVLFFSSLIDFFIASPMAILFFYGYLTKRKSFEVFFDISINTAVISALYYGYVLMLFNSWEWTPLNAFIGAAFIPIAVLYVLYLIKRIQGKSFILRTK